MAYGDLNSTFLTNTGTGINSGVNKIVEYDSKFYLGGSNGMTDFNGQTIGRLISINQNGTVNTEFDCAEGFDDAVSDLIINNGKLLCIGPFTTYKSNPVTKGIIQLNLDGSVDDSFSGFTTGFDTNPLNVKIDNNGYIVIVGYFQSFDSTACYGIVRLDPITGALDTTFNTAVGDGFNKTTATAYPRCVDIDSNNKYCLVGQFVAYNGTGATRIIKLNDDATIDTSFDYGSGFGATVYSLTLDDNDDWYVCGDFTTYKGSTNNRIIKILGASGDKDSSFNNSTGLNASTRQIWIDNFGYIYVAGYFTTWKGGTVNRILKVDSTGTKASDFITGTGFNLGTTSIMTDRLNQIYYSGDFISYQGTSVSRLAKIDNTPYDAAAPSNLTCTTVTHTTISLSWTNNTTLGTTNVIQKYNDITGTWFNIGSVGIDENTYTATGLLPNTYYYFRVYIYDGGKYFYSPYSYCGTLQFPFGFCEEGTYTVNNATCGNSDGSIVIDNADYEIFYTFTLVDLTGGTHSYPFTGLSSNYYFMTATVKPAYEYFYGRNVCEFDWILLDNSDTDMSLINTIVRPQQCGPFDIQKGRIYYNVSGVTSGNTYTIYTYNVDRTLFYIKTGCTSTEDFVVDNTIADCYYSYIVNNTTGCVLLLGRKCIVQITPFNLTGIKKLYIAKWSDDVDYNYWNSAEDNYFLEFVDTSFFNSTKIKNFSSLSGGTITWYELPVHNQICNVTQKLEKVRQGFVFTDEVSFAVGKADAVKWTSMSVILNPENKWLVVIQDANGNWWTIGYRHGAEINSYSYTTGNRGEDNGYNLVIKSLSENKILTALDETYVDSYIK